MLAPGFIEPMLLAPRRVPPEGESWWAELKLDGARGQLRVIDGVACLRTRHGRRCDSEFPEIIAAAAGLPDVILDGEIVVPDSDGHPDFTALRVRLGVGADRARVHAAARPARFYAFDALWHDGQDLRRTVLSGRRQVLDTLPLTAALALVETHPGQAQAVLDFAKQHSLEGIVVKHADSLYRSGRSAAWRKFKIRHHQRVWITAWMPGGPGELDRYWVSRPIDGHLIPAGEVCLGLKPGQVSQLRHLLSAADLGAKHRNGPRLVAPVISMTVAGHGKPSGWLRDPVITEMHIDPTGPYIR